MSTAVQVKQMELEGNLSAFQLADVLKFLAMGRMSGALVLDNKDQSIRLIFREGLLTGTASGDRDLKLGQLLIYGGKLTRKQLQETLDQQRDRRGILRLGKHLLDKKLVDRETLQKTLMLQVKEELWEAFHWRDGSFRFENGSPDAEDDVLALETGPLIDEALQRLEHWRIVSRNLGNMNQVFRVSAKISGPPEPPLNPSAWRVLSMINGRLSLRGLVYLSGLGKFETFSALDQLLTQGLVEAVGAGAPSKPRANIESIAQAEQPAASEPAAQAEPQVVHEAGGAVIRSLFGLVRRSAGNAAAAEPRGHAAATRIEAPGSIIDAAAQQTSVGFACALINRLADKCDATKRKGEPVAELWEAESARRPRTDLVRVFAGRLDASLFERYAAVADGIDRFLSGCHEETMEALAIIVRDLSKRVGRDNADEAAAAVLEHGRTRFPSDFSPRAWVSELLEH